MNCQSAKISIQKSQDAALSQTEREGLDTHIAECAECRQERDAQRRLTRLADRWLSHSLALSDPGEEFTAQVLARLGPEPRLSRLSFGLPLMATLLLVAALLLLPGMPDLGLNALAQTVHGFPSWLTTNLHALPSAAGAIVRLPQAYLVPSWTGAALLGAAGLNGFFCFYARHPAMQRTTS